MNDIQLSDLGHKFTQSAWLFRHLSARLETDRVYAVVGPSGSGKSTLLSILADWVRPAEGTVVRKGITTVSWVFQNPHGVARRTALDHVRLPFLARGLPLDESEQEAARLIEMFGLAKVAHQRFSALSGGEAQRLMLARGIASDPDLLLIDEPTAQLDTATSKEVNSSIARLQRPGMIVVIATHDQQTRDFCTDVLDLLEYSS